MLFRSDTKIAELESDKAALKQYANEIDKTSAGLKSTLEISRTENLNKAKRIESLERDVNQLARENDHLRPFKKQVQDMAYRKQYGGFWRTLWKTVIGK